MNKSEIELLYILLIWKLWTVHFHQKALTFIGSYSTINSVFHCNFSDNDDEDIWCIHILVAMLTISQAEWWGSDDAYVLQHCC